jgi:hypothetical protein
MQIRLRPENENHRSQVTGKSRRTHRRCPGNLLTRYEQATSEEHAELLRRYGYGVTELSTAEQDKLVSKSRVS